MPPPLALQVVANRSSKICSPPLASTTLQRIRYTWNEKIFAEQMEMNTTVKVYAKLPRWFHVPTPLGPHNPDWAVLIENDDGERLYFVAETKGTSFPDDLRNRERAKAECGKEHFATLEVGDSPAKYRIVHTLDELFH